MKNKGGGRGLQQGRERKQVGRGRDRRSPKVDYSQRVMLYLHIKSSSTMVKVLGVQSLVASNV